MKNLIFVIIFFCTLPCIYGQNNNIKIRKNEKGIIEYVKFPKQYSDSKQIKVPKTANDFFSEYLETTSDFTKRPQKQRDSVYNHERYDQYYNGIKVDGGGYNFHYKNGKMYLANGNYIEIGKLNTLT